MKKKKLITIFAVVLSLILTIALSTGVIYAAYSFNRAVTTEEADVGLIMVDSKRFISYKNSSNGKMRVDSVVRLDGFSLDSNLTYVQTTDSTFQSTKAYYVVGTYTQVSYKTGEALVGDVYVDTKGGFQLTEDTEAQFGTSYYNKTANTGYTQTFTVARGSAISGTYYEQKITYTGVNSISTITNPAGDTLTATIDSTKKIITVKNGDTTVVVVTVALGTNGLASATTNNTNYYCVIEADYLGLLVIDKTKSSGSVIDSTSVKCSASETKYNADDIYLNQLGMEFTFTNEIAVYARIHIQDAWIKTKVYSSNLKESYSIKDQIAGNSPFAITSNDWYYNPAENTLYFKTLIVPEKNEDGTYKSHSYSFMVNEAYYYINSGTTSIYNEFVDVEVSFTVDLVQANRAKDLWKIDPSTLS